MGRKVRFVIAIDGPAASGKSTVAAEVARRLDALMFDTGAVYRALTYAALERSIDSWDAERLAELAPHLAIQVVPPTVDDGRQYTVRIDGEDVTWGLREQRIDQAVSPVSAHASVREALLELQRAIGREGRVVMPGRDIGTVVIPDAELKIWLDASLDERAGRRQLELSERGIFRSHDDVRDEMDKRDRRDASRLDAPMERASDAVRISTDELTIEQVVEQIIQLAKYRGLVCAEKENSVE